eukprot:TRINITY_DN56295_c0_g1_i1.p1 TRINITY_DN56295_c0_g1~~TRINITY_DN56295_c0_g1_i1.p1  ORF type:complete len:292 (-),score=66.40 TRINITY_DN56295_c0_g1_i1:171-980(-)
MIQLWQGIALILEGTTVKSIEGCNALFTALGLNPQIGKGFMAIANRDVSGIADIAMVMGQFDADKIQKFTFLLNKMMPKKKKKPEGDEDTPKAGSVMPLMVDDKTGKLSPGQLFKMFDKDKSGQIEYDEFIELLRYMNLHVTKEKARKLFARADTDGDGAIAYNEFDAAVEIVEEQISGGVLAMLGLSTATMVKIFVTTLVLLLLIFVFIFCGIIAFTTGTAFAAVVNSLMPAGAGVSVASDAKDKIQEKVEKIKEKLEDMLEMLTGGD